jgi:hypothetical protein
LVLKNKQQTTNNKQIYMRKNKGFTIATKMLGIVTGLVMLCSISNADKSPLPAVNPAKTQYDAPTLSCGNGAQSYIEVRVTAGASGAPAGFTVQWETLADYTSCRQHPR